MMKKELLSMTENFVLYKELAAQETYEGNAGAGMVVVKVNGLMQVVDVKIDPTVFKNSVPEILDDLDFMSDLFKSAVNQAVDRAAKAVLEKSMGSFLDKKSSLSGFDSI